MQLISPHCLNGFVASLASLASLSFAGPSCLCLTPPPRRRSSVYEHPSHGLYPDAPPHPPPPTTPYGGSYMIRRRSMPFNCSSPAIRSKSNACVEGCWIRESPPRAKPNPVQVRASRLGCKVTEMEDGDGTEDTSTGAFVRVQSNCKITLVGSRIT